MIRAKEYASQIDKTVIDNVHPATTKVESLRRSFKLFRDNALYHFFWVNLDLKAQCEEILKIREPLQRLLDKV